MLYARDMTLQSLQFRFVDAQRLRVMRALAVAPWAKVAALDHSRVTTLFGLDMTRVGATAQLMVQICVGLITLGVQLAVVAALVAGAGGDRRGSDRGRRRRAAAAPAPCLYQRSKGHARRAVDDEQRRGVPGRAEDRRGAADARPLRRRIRRGAGAVARRAGWRSSAGRRGRGWRFSIGSAFVLAAVVLGGVGLLGIAPARLIIVVLVFARMIGPVQQLQQSVVAIAYGLPSFAAVTAAEAHFAAEPEPLGEAAGAGPIVLDGVRYLHGDSGGLTAATLTIAEGSITGITGPSGGGKTTLIDVITGLIAPQAGDGHGRGQAADRWLGRGGRVCPAGRVHVPRYGAAQSRLGRRHDR